MTEHKKFDEASQHDDWIREMNEELDQIEKNNTWELVPRPEDKYVIGSKWVFKNKMNEKGQVVRNKPDWFVKGMHKLKVRTLMKLLHQWQDWRPSECSMHIHAIRTLKCIRWMLSHLFLMEI
jgi:hypothetical protein